MNIVKQLEDKILSTFRKRTGVKDATLDVKWTDDGVNVYLGRLFVCGGSGCSKREALENALKALKYNTATHL